MILGIETATEVCSAALVHQGTVLGERSLYEKNIHSERLLMIIDEVLIGASFSAKNLDAIAVSIGPGSFTGLRIGLSIAKGLALACDTPLLAVPTLDGIAESYRLSIKKDQAKFFCAMIDAKRDEAFYAFYAVENESRRESEFSIALKEIILQDAHIRHAVTEQPKISAASIALLGEHRQKEFIVSDFSHCEPLYLRDFVVTTPKK
ncbi:MAG: tRNA (adenosine(37)-N6)-threonylcarbamoyltransferase complex dimerization subunit type 1 TsaB [Ignavibacteriales bacterium]|nr:tRNA (adenosine(37)-N6)-threonylcarbamoyltransferase complex dimerization subunit type 1 TsaB [Ignavibacteriales bacterium]